MGKKPTVASRRTTPKPRVVATGRLWFAVWQGAPAPCDPLWALWAVQYEAAEAGSSTNTAVAPGHHQAGAAMLHPPAAPAPGLGFPRGAHALWKVLEEKIKGKKNLWDSRIRWR